MNIPMADDYYATLHIQQIQQFDFLMDFYRWYYFLAEWWHMYYQLLDVEHIVLNRDYPDYSKKSLILIKTNSLLI